MRPSVRPYLAAPGYVYAERPEAIAARYGFDRVARLGSNENPFGPSPRALEAASAALADAHRYPDESMGALRAALAARYGDRAYVVGNGMDGIIETVLRVFCESGDRVAVSTPTFSFYGIAARGQGAGITTVPRDREFGVDVEGFAAACRGAKVAFLCTPNNPTGTATPVEDVRAIAESVGDCLLFLDNAYVDFSDRDYRPAPRLLREPGDRPDLLQAPRPRRLPGRVRDAPRLASPRVRPRRDPVLRRLLGLGRGGRWARSTTTRTWSGRGRTSPRGASGSRPSARSRARRPRRTS